MSEPQVLLQETHGPVRLITMPGVPKRGNPISRAYSRQLLDAIVEAEQAPDISAVVLAGAEKYFSVGSDLAELRTMNAVEAVESDWLEEFDRIALARKPLIAAVRGHAVGGGFELALSCDIIVAAEDASLALPETGIGVIAGQGGTQRLIQRAGLALATDMILTGRRISGAEAVQLGVAARACPAGEVITTAIEIGKTIAERSPASIRFAREVLRAAGEDQLRHSMRIERLLASVLLDDTEMKRRVGDFFASKQQKS